MKNVSFKFLTVLMSAFILTFVVSCKKDDDGGDDGSGDGTPVYQEDFDYSIDGNTVTFTTTLSGNVWFTNVTTGVENTAENGMVEVFIANAGTYPFTCNTLVSGSIMTSEEFNVVIDQDDLSYLEAQLWIDLTGGVDQSKTWRMDMNSAGYCVYFDGPVYYSGTEDDPYWAWDVVVGDDEWPYTDGDGASHDTYFNWSPDYPNNSWIMAAQDYGTITFSANDGVASTVKFGESATGSYTFDTTTMKIMLSGVTLPIDTGRVNEGQYEDLYTIRVFSLSDTAAQFGIKRVYEGGESSAWTMVYNFVCDDYEYDVVETYSYTPVLNTTLTAADMVGTWMYADVPMGWIDYYATGNLGTLVEQFLETSWSTRSDIVTELESWGLTGIGDVFTSNDTCKFIFDDQGNCTLNGVANTYSVADGIMTFGTALDTTEFVVALPDTWLNHYLSDTEVSLIDVTHFGSDQAAYTPEGLWIGQDDGSGTKFKGFQIVKQATK